MRNLSLLLFIVGTFQAYAQDSTFVNETCELLNLAPKTTAGQFKVIEDQAVKYAFTFSLVDTLNNNRLQDFYRFQYKWRRALIRTCPIYTLGEFNIRTQEVVDLEDKFTKKQIGSLRRRIQEINKEKELHLFLITVDEYFPARSLEEFATIKRQTWGHGRYTEKGEVLIVISFANRQIRIATSDAAMKYLTDAECTGVINSMTPEFKKGNYYKGIILGLYNLENEI